MRFFRIPDNLVPLMASLVVGGVLVSSLAAADAYREVVGQTRRVATNLTLTVERDVGRDLHLVDLSIEGIIQALQLRHIDDVDEEIRHAALFDAAMNQEEFGAFVVLDRNGQPVDISGQRVLPKLDFSDRGYFRQHQGSPSLEPFLGPVLVSRLDGRAAITLSRRIPAVDGSFAGVVVGTVHLAFFRHAFDRLDLGAHGSITLVQDDGSIVIRDPELPEGSALSEKARQTYREAARKPSGFGIALGPDGVYRFYAYHRVADLPMFVVVGFAVRDVLAPWLQKFAVVGSLTILLCAAAIYLTHALHRELKRRHEAEAQLLRFNQELEARVLHEVAAREEAQGRLVAGQRMEALGQLAGGVAHDFNNALQAISSANRLLVQQAPEGSSQERLSGMIGEAADRGASVARRLLVFARQGELRAEVVDVSALVHGLRDLLTLTLGSGVDVRVKGAPGLPPVLVDRVQLETVLVNLATNARDAMLAAGGLLTIEARRPLPLEIRHGHARRDVADAVCIVVSDTGCGMDGSVLARATEPFFTTKAPGKGTGLGLAMAAGFAEQSGGTLTIASEVGVGSVITLWLPECQASVDVPRAGAVRPGRARRAGEPARILLVDDDEIVRSLLTEELEGLGYEVAQAEAAGVALGMIASRPDVLVTDLSMPGMDGLALINEVHRRFPDIPAILVTGYAGDSASLARSGANSGRYVLLHKPLRTAHLVEAITTSLRAEMRSAGAPSAPDVGKRLARPGLPDQPAFAITSVDRAAPTSPAT